MRCCLSGLLVLVGCSGPAGTDTAASACADAPRLTWESHGQAILTEHCQPCHASTSTLRNGAPEEVTFDTRDEAVAWKARILATSTSDDPTMPPNIDLPALDRDNLWIWLTCWE